MRGAYAAGYADLERWHWWFRARRELLSDVLRANLPRPSEGLRLASLACGPLASVTWLARFAGPGGMVVGLDADPSGELRRQERGASAPPGCRLVFGRLEQPPLRPGHFDAVLLLDVLEHIEDDVSGLTEAARLLRPGGTLLVTVPAGPSLWGLQDQVSHDFRRYTRRTLIDLFARVGLPVLKMSHFNALLYPGVAAVRWGRRLLRLQPSGGSDFELNRPGVINEGLRAIMATERRLLRHASLPLGVSLLGLSRAP